jgi:hypothetical protein
MYVQRRATNFRTLKVKQSFIARVLKKYIDN